MLLIVSLLSDKIAAGAVVAVIARWRLGLVVLPVGVEVAVVVLAVVVQLVMMLLRDDGESDAIVVVIVLLLSKLLLVWLPLMSWCHVVLVVL